LDLPGALTYLVAPELNHTLKAFQQAVKATPQHPQILEETYQVAINAIDHFQQAYANGLKPTRSLKFGLRKENMIFNCD